MTKKIHALAMKLMEKHDIGYVKAREIIRDLEFQGIIKPSYGVRPKYLPENISEAELIEEVRAVVRKAKKRSASLVQEKLNIYYDTAKRILKKIK